MDAPSVPDSDALPTFAGALSWGTEELASSGVDEAALTAELLLAWACGVRRGELARRRSSILHRPAWNLFRQALWRRCRREPLQYIVGDVEFMGLRFAVRPGVLIPRPETEQLVEECERILRARRLREPRILDLGAGSGNISVSLAVRLPGLRADALERSDDALAVARENCAFHRVDDRVTLVRGDLFGDDWIVPGRQYDLLVSNPPYIPLAEFATLDPEIRYFEPAVATTDGGDGLSSYRRIAHIGRSLVTPGGAIVVEIAYNQGMSVPEIFTAAGYADVAVLKDYAGHPRIVRAC